MFLVTPWSFSIKILALTLLALSSSSQSTVGGNNQSHQELSADQSKYQEIFATFLEKNKLKLGLLLTTTIFSQEHHITSSKW